MPMTVASPPPRSTHSLREVVGVVIPRDVLGDFAVAFRRAFVGNVSASLPPVASSPMRRSCSCRSLPRVVNSVLRRSRILSFHSRRCMQKKSCATQDESEGGGGKGDEERQHFKTIDSAGIPKSGEIGPLSKVPQSSKACESYTGDADRRGISARVGACRKRKRGFRLPPAQAPRGPWDVQTRGRRRT